MSCSGCELLIDSKNASEYVHVRKPRSTSTCPLRSAVLYAPGPNSRYAVEPSSIHVDHVATAFTRASCPATVAATRPPCETPTRPSAPPSTSGFCCNPPSIELRSANHRPAPGRRSAQPLECPVARLEVAVLRLDDERDQALEQRRLDTALAR